MSGTQYIADYRNKTIYNKANPLKSKQVKDLGDIEQCWTLTQPPHQYVTWNEELDDWQTDVQAKYEAQADAAYLKIHTDNPWPEKPV
ncbi:hypothetical protein CSW98_00880 [Vibrio sp. HA2012]|uniref:hypothetical protein n=1 Tax=Vibrio sp. HA2012 TaxID=1971595 RepID=UPI000C2B74D3|nr:hypothetical protein [Vibrio sp. HA2012]PJC87714.1 hypothetical protein CSW98_00880 [Vibrio sp. HA2012]